MKSLSKIILLAHALILLALPAYAQTPITKEAANAFFGQCMAQQDPRMREGTQEALCACSAVQMMENLSVEDVQIMGENTPRGRKMLNKMLIEVYAPCMDGPVADLVHGQCEEDPRVNLADNQINRGAVCHCMADKAGAWFAADGPGLMAQILARHPFTQDPIGPVMESDIYKKQTYEIMLSCMEDAMQ